MIVASWRSRPSSLKGPRLKARTMPSGSTKKEVGLPSAQVVLPGLVVGVVEHGPLGALVGGERAPALDGVVVEDAQDLQAVVGVRLVGLHHQRELLATGTAPGGPEVDEHRPAAQRGERHALAVEASRRSISGAGLP